MDLNPLDYIALNANESTSWWSLKRAQAGLANASSWIGGVPSAAWGVIKNVPSAVWDASSAIRGQAKRIFDRIKSAIPWAAGLLTPFITYCLRLRTDSHLASLTTFAGETLISGGWISIILFVAGLVLWKAADVENNSRDKLVYAHIAASTFAIFILPAVTASTGLLFLTMLTSIAAYILAQTYIPYITYVSKEIKGLLTVIKGLLTVILGTNSLSIIGIKKNIPIYDTLVSDIVESASGETLPKIDPGVGAAGVQLIPAAAYGIFSYKLDQQKFVSDAANNIHRAAQREMPTAFKYTMRDLDVRKNLFGGYRVEMKAFVMGEYYTNVLAVFHRVYIVTEIADKDNANNQALEANVIYRAIYYYTTGRVAPTEDEIIWTEDRAERNVVLDKADVEWPPARNKAWLDDPNRNIAELEEPGILKLKTIVNPAKKINFDGNADYRPNPLDDFETKNNVDHEDDGVNYKLQDVTEKLKEARSRTYDEIQKNAKSIQNTPKDKELLVELAEAKRDPNAKIKGDAAYDVVQYVKQKQSDERNRQSRAQEIINTPKDANADAEAHKNVAYYTSKKNAFEKYRKMEKARKA